MQWGEHRPFWKWMSQNLKGTRQECTAQILAALKKLTNEGARVNTAAQLIIECAWIDDSRPYYDLYPSVIEAFGKVDLDSIKCRDLKLPLPQLLIRFPRQHDGPRSKYGPVQCVLVGEGEMRGEYRGEKRGWLVMTDEGGDMAPGVPAVTTTSFTMPDDETIQQRLVYGREHGYCNDDIDNDMVDSVMRIVVTLCMLHGNPDLIEPEPLSSDMQRWEQTQDQALIDRAVRKGKRAWAVGKHIEVAPGFRRPHFAIRWIGKGEPKIPMLRPIKGCIVNRKKLTEVPTGYLDELDHVS